MDILVPNTIFQQFASAIAALPPDKPLTRDDLLTPAFCLALEGNIQIYYIPFEVLSTCAELVLVGITPGWTQMEIAYRVARDHLRKGEDALAVCQEVDRQASFAGTMRQNLIRMLDALGAASHRWWKFPGQSRG